MMKNKIVHIFLLISIMFLSCVKTDPKEYIPKKATEEAFRRSMQLSFALPLDSLSNLVGEKFTVKKNMFYDDFLWATFNSDEKLLLKNQALNRPVLNKEDKQFFVKYFMDLYSSKAKVSDSLDINVDSLECVFIYHKESRYRIKAVRWLITDKSTNNHFYGKASGQFLKYPENYKDGIEKVPSISYERLSISSEAQLFHGQTKIFPYVGRYNYSIFSSAQKVYLKYRSDERKITSKEKIEKALSWFREVNPDYFTQDYLVNADIDTCYLYYKHNNSEYHPYIKAKWLMYDKKNDKYYYAECSGKEGENKYIHHPLVDFEKREKKDKVRKR